MWPAANVKKILGYLFGELSLDELVDDKRQNNSDNKFSTKLLEKTRAFNAIEYPFTSAYRPRTVEKTRGD